MGINSSNVFSTLSEGLACYITKDLEDKKVKQLFSIYPDIKEKGYIDYDAFIQIASRKSPRPRHRYESNSPQDVKDTTTLAFQITSNEKLRIHTLTALSGVSLPVASALLALYDRKSYGIIDIRARQLLYHYKEVSTNPVGKGFSLNQWVEYIQILRKYATQFGVDARTIEICLYYIHSDYQEGLLYK